MKKGPRRSSTALRCANDPTLSGKLPEIARGKALYPTGALLISQEFYVVNDELDLGFKAQV